MPNPTELNLYGLWWGKQTAQGAENTTPPKRGIQVGGDFSLQREEGTEDWSDRTLYGGQTQWINSLVGSGSPALEATPSETAHLLWLAHGAEAVVAGTDDLWTLGGSPTTGTFTLNIYDGVQNIAVAAIANTVTSAALDTSLEAALLAAGYGANAVTCAGGPLNTTPVTITFNGVTGNGTAKKKFWLTKTADTTSPSVTVVNTTPGVKTKHTVVPSLTAPHWATFVRSVGGGSLTTRHAMLDSFIGGWTLEASTANKAVRFTPSLFSADPFKVVASDPAAALPTGVDQKPFLFTDSTAAFMWNGVALQATTEVTMTTTLDKTPVYGDDAVPYGFASGNANATLAFSAIFDSVTYAHWCELAYGSASPATGAKPLRSVGANIAWAATFGQKGGDGNLTGNKLVVTIPNLHLALPDMPAPTPAGGNAVVAFTGAIIPPGGAVNPYTIDVFNSDSSTYTV